MRRKTQPPPCPRCGGFGKSKECIGGRVFSVVCACPAGDKWEKLHAEYAISPFTGEVQPMFPPRGTMGDWG